MMIQPWMKFYPSDWRADPALRMCSISARGLWMEMLCIMHEAEPRGSLLINGRRVNERQMSSLTGATVREVHTWIAELELAGVFSRDDTGTIYSRRMKRDQEKAEQDKANGKAGGNPRLKRGVNPRVKAQKLEARSQNLEEDIFERFWKAYPKRKGTNPKHPARLKWLTAIESGVDPEAIISGAGRYAAEIQEMGKADTEFVKQAVVWLNQRVWEDYPLVDETGKFSGVWLGEESPEFEAWTVHWQQTKGKKPPIQNGGWYFPSQWPPNYPFLEAAE